MAVAQPTPGRPRIFYCSCGTQVSRLRHWWYGWCKSCIRRLAASARTRSSQLKAHWEDW